MGSKFDNGKPQMDLVPPEAILGMAKVLTFGAVKYGAEDWRNPPFVGVRRMYAAVLRHLNAWARGEDDDPESGQSHLCHALTGLAMLYTKLLTQPGTDDRWFKLAKQTAHAMVGHMEQKPAVGWHCAGCGQDLTCREIDHACSSEGNVSDAPCIEGGLKVHGITNDDEKNTARTSVGPRPSRSGGDTVRSHQSTVRWTARETIRRERWTSEHRHQLTGR